jgi:hypothetical protein
VKVADFHRFLRDVCPAKWEKGAHV